VRDGFTITPGGFTSPLGRVDGELYVGRWSAGGVGDRIDINGDGTAEAVFSASCGFLLQLQNGIVTKAEADRAVTLTIYGNSYSLTTHAPVAITGGSTPSNVAPTVTLTAPAAGASFQAPASVTVSASASDSDGTIAKVDFYDGASLIGSDSTTPYSIAWSAAVGSHSLSAKAIDNAGAVGTSAARAITVTSAPSSGSGTGLKGEYYDNMDFTALAITRIDPTVNFDWQYGSPDAAIGVDTFSARWTGKITAKATETVTFYTLAGDGTRLWVNGTLVIDNWTDHGTVETSGTIALTGGTSYDIRLDFYDNTGRSACSLLWSSPSIAKQVVPQGNLYPPSAVVTPPAPIVINFQPAAVAIPAGALVDSGDSFAARTGGRSYGWNAANPTTRDRDNAASPDQLHDTFIHMQRAENPDARWEIALPTGLYQVRVVAGDAGYIDSTYRITVEGTLAVDGTPTATQHWLDRTVTVSVTDGRLTIANAAGAVNNKIAFVVITPVPSGAG
jgi:hypothetical protein